MANFSKVRKKWSGRPADEVDAEELQPEHGKPKDQVGMQVGIVGECFGDDDEDVVGKDNSQAHHHAD